MNSERATSPIPTITARPSPDEKARFIELAGRLGISESTLALTAIRVLLDSSQSPPNVLQPGTGREPATDRITIRLRPGDANAIQDRATRRGFKPSAYIAALVRAHLTHNPPLPKNEVIVLKQGIAVLSRIGQLMAQNARRTVEQGDLPAELQSSSVKPGPSWLAWSAVRTISLERRSLHGKAGMTRRPVRLPRDSEPMLDIFSLGRPGPPRHLTPQQIRQISRTVRRIPEVMVKVTGGGANAGAVEAHFSYISRKGTLEIETDDGVRARTNRKRCWRTGT